MGRFLVADLTCTEAWSVPLPAWLREGFVGGKGFGARLLCDLVTGAAPEIEAGVVAQLQPERLR